MLSMQYLVPSNFPEPYGEFDKDASKLAASLKDVDTKWTLIPETDLQMKLNVHMDGSSLEIKKTSYLVFINMFCINGFNASKLLGAVQALYEGYNLGHAKQPAVENWIHSIPAGLGYYTLSEDEIRLCEKLTVCFFWAVLGQEMRLRKPFN